MATGRWLRPARPSSSAVSSPSSSSLSSVKTVRCISNMSPGEKLTSGDSQRRRTVAGKAAPATFETMETTKTGELIDLASLLAKVGEAVHFPVKVAGRIKIRKQQIQILIEKVIIDCRFFTLLAVAGSLLGSILCFVEGSFIVAESYLQYFQTLLQKSDKGHLVELLIEAIDVFLVGTALLVFGVGLYAMFVRSTAMKKLPRWAEMESVLVAKSKIGHAVMMILQVDVLEKLKNVPLISAGDLACFAGAVLVISASVFFLSRLGTNYRILNDVV